MALMSSIVNHYSYNYKGFAVFLQAISLIMYSSVLSLPLHTMQTSDRHRNIGEADKWNKTDVTRGLKLKKNLLSKNIPQNTENLSQSENVRKSKSGDKRGLNIGVKIRVPPTTNYNKELNQLEEVLELAKMNLEGNLEQVLNASICPKCDEEEMLPIIEKRRLKPAYQCDEWDAKYRLCILERNIGDTVTFYLSTGKAILEKPKVTWKKEFHMKYSKDRTGFVLDPGNPPDNIIIGKQGYELRISPITELDIGYNLFSASLIGHLNAQSKLYFMIRVVPIDLGFVYVGETVELNLRSYVSLPAESFSFVWYMEKYAEHSTLPSNMRTCASGSSIKISELRQEQEGVLACSIYTNLNFLATKKRFLIKDLIKNNDVLKSAPDHNLQFKEEANTERRRRFPKKFIRHKRNIDAEDIEKAFMDFTSADTRTRKSKDADVITRPYNDYDVEMGFGNPEPTQNIHGIINNALSGESPVQPLDISAENSPIDVQETALNPQAVEKYEDTNELRSESSILNGMKMNKGPNSLNQYSIGQNSGAENKISPIPNNFGINLEQQQFLPQNIYRNAKNHPVVNIEEGKDNSGSLTEDSDIILNIERIRGPRRITAEENISKLISSCFSDYECSGSATCVRSNLKQAGYCKCLPGFFGVGIFCREDVWIGKDYGMEGLHNPDDFPYSSNLPIAEETS